MNHNQRSFQENNAIMKYLMSLHFPGAKDKWAMLALFILLPSTACPARSQGLSYEGPTGIFVTPLAYVSPSPANGVGGASASYHFLAGGPILGDFSTVSITAGFAKRFEVGYTAEIHANGTNPVFSELWRNDFSIVHGKANIVPENILGWKWVPAVSVGGVFRFNDKDVFNGGRDLPTYPTNPASLLEVQENDGHYQNTWNGDGYIVASKTITQVWTRMPIILSGGARATNAVLWGLGGNASAFKTRGFGSVALAFTLPGGVKIIPAGEFSQQPHQLKYGGYSTAAGGNVPGTGIRNYYSILDVPSSEVYAVRIIPSPKYRLNLDAGVLHAGDNIGSIPAALNTSGANIPVRLDAKARVAFGLSYNF